MENTPRWAIWLALALIAAAAAFTITANLRRLKNERKARQLLDQGKVTVALSPGEIQQIVSEIKKSIQP
ncbi:MAG: hypothetical protein IT190_09670 [Microbacteriaceae bacterium]|nr:hypothetical protein [Microbacteriaceae bacterium]